MFDYFRNCSNNAVKFAVKIIRLKVYMIFSQSDNLLILSFKGMIAFQSQT